MMIKRQNGESDMVRPIEVLGKPTLAVLRLDSLIGEYEKVIF